MNIKSLITLVLVILLALTVVGCNSNDDDTDVWQTAYSPSYKVKYPTGWEIERENGGFIMINSSNGKEFKAKITIKPNDTAFEERVNYLKKNKENNWENYSCTQDAKLTNYKEIWQGRNSYVLEGNTVEKLGEMNPKYHNVKKKLRIIKNENKSWNSDEITWTIHEDHYDDQIELIKEIIGSLEPRI